MIGIELTALFPALQGGSTRLRAVSSGSVLGLGGGALAGCIAGGEALRKRIGNAIRPCLSFDWRFLRA
jgi:hypothetical protein